MCRGMEWRVLRFIEFDAKDDSDGFISRQIPRFAVREAKVVADPSGWFMIA